MKRYFIKLLKPLIEKFPGLALMYRMYRDAEEVMRPARKLSLGFSFAGNDLIEAEQFEPVETALVQELLKEVEVVVNIGANIGYYSCLARHQGKKVMAFEPLEQNVRLLKRNLFRNGWQDVEVFPIGLGEQAGLFPLYGGGTAASFVEGWAGADKEHFEVVPVNTLDLVLQQRFQGKQCLFIIDVEGFELKVLRGGLEQMKLDPKPIWFIEICFQEHQPAGIIQNPDFLAVFDLFFENGYEARLANAPQNRVSREEVLSWVSGENGLEIHNFVFKQSS